MRREAPGVNGLHKIDENLIIFVRFNFKQNTLYKSVGCESTYLVLSYETF